MVIQNPSFPLAGTLESLYQEHISNAMKDERQQTSGVPLDIGPSGY
jgi:hypothetical protein